MVGLLLAFVVPSAMGRVMIMVPIVVALALGGVRMNHAIPAMVRLFTFGVIVILPLQFMWMKFLGFVP